jgi:hypothetical protein
MDEVKLNVYPSFDNYADIIVNGWKPLRILYSYERISTANFLFWKIENTDKIFKILDTDLYRYCGSNIANHFKDTLEKLREDYLIWEKLGFPEEWMKDYEKNYKNLIYK